jgi:hypothetical protein
MFGISTTQAGTCMAMPDVCLTPAPPAPPVPVPYPNIAQVSQANPATCSMNVKVANKPVCTKMTMIPQSNGDQAGVNGGVMSGMIMGPVQFSMASTMVTCEGQGAIFMGCPSRHNGVSANAPLGTQTVPSQSDVTTMG